MKLGSGVVLLLLSLMLDAVVVVTVAQTITGNSFALLKKINNTSVNS